MTQDLSAGGKPGRRMSKPRRLVAAPDVVLSNPEASLEAEMFRRLKAMLIQDAEESPQLIVVTSAEPNEGKTFVAYNLALTFAADTSTKTLLIDADMRRPSVSKKFEPAASCGLSEILAGRVSLEQGTCSFENAPLHIIPEVTTVDDPVRWLSSAHCKRFIETIRSRYQRIIIDTPPVVPFADAQILGGYSDGVILVVRAGETRIGGYKRALEELRATPMLGTVLNGSHANLADGGRYYEKAYYKYYGKKGT